LFQINYIKLPENNHFEIIKTEEVYKGYAFSVDVDEVCSSSGLVFERAVVKHPHSVVILPLDDQDNMVLVKQYRHPAKIHLLEAPAGKLEGDELPAECAQRELQEEIGYKSSNLKLLTEFYVSPGYSTEYMYAYLARGLEKSVLQPDFDEFIEVERYPIFEINNLITKGLVKDLKTIMIMMYLEKNPI